VKAALQPFAREDWAAEDGAPAPPAGRCAGGAGALML
jgi:hypothetical protein